MAYNKQTWVNSPNTSSPLSAVRLNHMEDGIEAANTPATTSADGQMSSMDKTKLDDLSSSAKNVSISVDGEAMTISIL